MSTGGNATDPGSQPAAPGSTGFGAMSPRAGARRTLAPMADFADATSTEVERKAWALQWVSLAESATYAALFGFWVSGNKTGTAIFGSLHGIVVIGFAAMVVMITPSMHWRWWFPVVAVATGPLGGLIVYERIRREGVPEEHRLATRAR